VIERKHIRLLCIYTYYSWRQGDGAVGQGERSLDGVNICADYVKGGDL